MKERSITNKARFWTGISMGITEILGVAIFGLTRLNWNWLTSKVVTIILVVTAILLYNGLSIFFILNGSKK